MVSYGFEERGAAAVAYREQRYFVVKLDEAFDYDAAAAGTASLLSILPSLVGLIHRAHDTLSVSRRTHDGFDNARNAYLT